MRTKKPEKKKSAIGKPKIKKARRGTPPPPPPKRREVLPHMCCVCGVTGSSGGYLLYAPVDNSLAAYNYYCLAHKPAVSLPDRRKVRNDRTGRKSDKNLLEMSQ